ncbi:MULTISPECIES: hypothetical protein [Mycobacterium]|jgi:NADPH:quinone reductase-like Zn-dependent oxidoreductase|nr:MULTISPECIES: hypothetical protein [Mycobacterium]MBX9981213.1 hypothetical protein [Mycobacterium gordonae]
MKRVVVSRYGGPEVLSVIEEDEHVLGPDQVCGLPLSAADVVRRDTK